MDLSKIFSFYKFICKNYFILSLIILILVPVVMYYTNVYPTTHLSFTFDDFSVLQLSFFVIANLIMIIIKNKIIKILMKSEFTGFISIIFIFPVLLSYFRVIEVLIGFFILS